MPKNFHFSFLKGLINFVKTSEPLQVIFLKWKKINFFFLHSFLYAHLGYCTFFAYYQIKMSEYLHPLNESPRMTLKHFSFHCQFPSTLTNLQVQVN